VHVAGAVVHIERLSALRHGAQQERVVPALPLFVLVEPDRGAFGVSSGALYRAIEIGRGPRALERLEASEHEAAVLRANIVHAAGVGGGEPSAHGRDIARTRAAGSAGCLRERRMFVQRTAAVLGVVFAVLSASGCATVVVPPAPPEQPQAVYLLDHGRHSSLVLPAEGGGGMTRWEYGDWAYFALNERGAGAASGALLGPSRAALGRQQLAAPASAAALRRGVRVPVERLHALEVESRAVRALRERLEGIHAAAEAAPVYNPRYELEFVPHPEPYSMGHNSNSVVAGWLESLGCRVQGPALLASWEVRSPDPAGAGTETP